MDAFFTSEWHHVNQDIKKHQTLYMQITNKMNSTALFFIDSFYVTKVLMFHEENGVFNANFLGSNEKRYSTIGPLFKKRSKLLCCTSCCTSSITKRETHPQKREYSIQSTL